ncbi:hypothetical protein JCM19231_124 [Vibrio ishigakensis]|uniref:Chaperone protein torD n=1 Tax=Vibrio ishigakensis TaxID=1481914 RepID=A0A0B8P6E0_9VIBR|nr:hypothetical protein JCM19231_124 [Vibrio ishigakensis]
MQEIKKFNEQRAEIYWWFSSLFSKELTDEELKRIKANKFAASYKAYLKTKS